jgi:hypothetical protein
MVSTIHSVGFRRAVDHGHKPIAFAHFEVLHDLWDEPLGDFVRRVDLGLLNAGLAVNTDSEFHLVGREVNRRFALIGRHA